MDAVWIGLLLVLLVFLVLSTRKAKRLEAVVAQRDQDVVRTREESQAAVQAAQRLVDQQLSDAQTEADRVRKHFEAQARDVRTASEAALASAREQLDGLQRYQGIVDADAEAQRLLSDALGEASSLRREATSLVDLARAAAISERAQAAQRAKEIRGQADALLDHATRESGRLVEEAHKQALEIGGDAYTALREKEQLERAVVAIHNVIEGYGDRYIVPTRSLLDDLADEFGHTEAGHELAAARQQTKRMVEEGHAAACDYVEANRRDTAIRFVIDAFNGRVDAILSRAKHDNHGTLAQEIRDAFALVNQNGVAFRNARILPAYLDTRLSELKWAVVVHELKLKEREEQRRIKEQMREEEKARREYERAIDDARREEAAIQKALARAHEEAARATADERAELERRIADLNDRLAVAELKNQRAISMAQQTRKGTVYVISNVGSFGEDVFKIGMTRRLEPADRIRELGDASVPFEFDVHAMISCDDAPALESKLHGQCEDHRINKVNYRKEFFRMPLERLREVVTCGGVEASFTLLAQAREYRETQALEKMPLDERRRYRLRRDEALDDA